MNDLGFLDFNFTFFFSFQFKDSGPMAETNNQLINLTENQKLSIFSYGQITADCD